MPDKNIMIRNIQPEKRGYFLEDNVLSAIEICLVNSDEIKPTFCHHCGVKLSFKNTLIVDDFLYCDNCIGADSKMIFKD